MHVGGTVGKVAQGGDFEFSHVAALARNGGAARIGIAMIHTYTDVCEFLRGKVRTGVALRAFALLVEEIEAILLLFGQRCFIAGHVAVVWGVSGHNSSLESGN